MRCPENSFTMNKIHVPFLIVILLISHWGMAQNNQLLFNFQIQSKENPDYLGNVPLDCHIDSVLLFQMNSPTDSVLVQRSIVNNYPMAQAIYSYEVPSNQLISYDSIVQDPLGRNILEETWEWNTDSMALQIENRTLYYFNDVTQNLDSTISYEIGFSSGIFGPDEKQIWLYDGQGNNISHSIQRWSEVSETWEYTNHEVFYYTAMRLDSSMTYYWNGSDTIADLIAYYSYFPNDSLQSKTSYEFETGIPFEKEEHSYDKANATKISHGYSWDASIPDWILTSTIVADRDEFGRLSYFSIYADFFGFIFGIRIDQFYIGDTECVSYLDTYDAIDSVTWELSERVHSYPKGSPSSVSSLDKSRIEIFPNPNPGSFTINANSGSFIRIYNMLGNLIFSSTSSGSDRIELPAITSGYYSIIIQEGQDITTQKVMIIKD